MTSQLLPNVEIREHIRGDVASPATRPLLSFLLNFVGEERDYLDVIKHMDGKALWGIGRKALARPCLSETSDESSQSGTSEGSQDEIPDESAQDETALLNIINGPGLQAVTPGPTVG